MNKIIEKFDYRPEIDGLRALAVIPVVLFHFHMHMPGGFLGVDVFFVISGFLITSLLIRDFEEKKFSFIGFWERRARRILPASSIAVGTTVMAGYFLLLPSEYGGLGTSLMRQTVFLSNIHFYKRIDYFSGGSEEMPLLHTWSLAVEEQFYFIAPVLLWLIFKFCQKRRFSFLLVTISSLWVLSFTWSIIETNVDNQAAFYLLPSRAWELLSGSLLAMIPQRMHPKGAIQQLLFGWVAVVILVVLNFLYSSTTQFPGISAFPVCFCTGLFIWSTRQRMPASEKGLASFLPSRVFSAGPLVFIGKMSYSLYLWHWPIAAYSNYWFGESWPLKVKCAAIGLSIMLSITSYYLVETPFRKRRIGCTTPSMLYISAASIAILFCFGAAIRTALGFSNKFAPPGIYMEYADRAKRGEWTTETNLQDAIEGNFIKFGNCEKPTIDLLIWGDSHARAILPGAKPIAESMGAHFQSAWHGGTFPAMNFIPDSPFSLGKDTPEYSRAILKYIINHDVKNVLLVGFWNKFYESEHEQEKFETGLLETVSALRGEGIDVWVLLDWPMHDIKIPRAVWGSDRFGVDFSERFRTPKQHKILSSDMERFSIKLKSLGARIIDPSPYFLSASRETFEVIADGYPLYYDTHHLSVRGAGYLSPVFRLIMDHQGENEKASPEAQ